MGCLRRLPRSQVNGVRWPTLLAGGSVLVIVLCFAEVGTFALYDGSGFRGAAVYGHSQQYADVLSRVHRAPPGTGLGQMEATRQTVQVADVGAEAAYDEVRRLNPDFGRVTASG